MSYQAIVLPSWSRNPNKRLVKASKVHYMDLGVIHAVLNKQGGLSGNELESAIISEIYKQTCNAGNNAQFSFLRTHDGKEVDLLIEFQDYYYAFEVKMAEKVNRTDAKHLFGLEEKLDKPVKSLFTLKRCTYTIFRRKNDSHTCSNVFRVNSSKILMNISTKNDVLRKRKLKTYAIAF